MVTSGFVALRLVCVSIATGFPISTAVSIVVIVRPASIFAIFFPFFSTSSTFPTVLIATAYVSQTAFSAFFIFADVVIFPALPIFLRESIFPASSPTSMASIFPTFSVFAAGPIFPVFSVFPASRSSATASCFLVVTAIFFSSTFRRITILSSAFAIDAPCINRERFSPACGIADRIRFGHDAFMWGNLGL